MTNINLTRLAFIASIALASSSAACTSEIAAYCEKSCGCASECRGDEEIDECVARGEASEEIASIYECGDEFDEVVSCANDERSCDADSACSGRVERLQTCLVAAEAYGFARWGLTDGAP